MDISGVQRDLMEARLLDDMIVAKILTAKATDADKAKAKDKDSKASKAANRASLKAKVSKRPSRRARVVGGVATSGSSIVRLVTSSPSEARASSVRLRWIVKTA